MHNIITLQPTETFINSPESNCIRIQFTSSDQLTENSVNQTVQTVNQLIPNLISSKLSTGENQEENKNISIDIPILGSKHEADRAVRCIHDTLWLNQHGDYTISKTGKLFDRIKVDHLCVSIETFSFKEQPFNEENSIPVDTSKLIPELTKKQSSTLYNLKRDKRRDKKVEANKIRKDYVSQWVRHYFQDPSSNEHKRLFFQCNEALEKNILASNLTINLVNHGQLSVGQILSDPERFHLEQVYNPIDPTHQSGETSGKLLLIGGQKKVSLFDEHNTEYRLKGTENKIVVHAGSLHRAVEDTLFHLRNIPEIFDFENIIATIYKGTVEKLEERQLSHFLSSQIQYYTIKVVDGDEIEVPINPPLNLVKTIISLGSKRELKKLKGVIDTPVITPEGKLISKPGYDSASGLFLDLQSPFPDIPMHPTNTQVKNAVKSLMHPFSEFPFETPSLDKSVLLAGLLSAAIRGVIPTCPGIAVDAPTQGSGKTLLAECIAALATGREPTTFPALKCGSDEERRKRFLPLLMMGEKAAIEDNVTGTYRSTSVAKLLTGETYSDRILGSSINVTFPNKMLFLITGNNIILDKDLARRFLRLRINPKTDQPFSREFELNPKSYVFENRAELIAAALTIILGWFNSHERRAGLKADGSLASFEEWDNLVRQPIAWLGREQLPGEFCDVMEAIQNNNAEDEETNAVSEFLFALNHHFREKTFTAAELLNIYNDVSQSDTDSEQLLVILALEEIGFKKGSSASSIGRLLKARQGIYTNGLVLKQSQDKSNNSSIWQIVAY